jgi:hypothetical protein
MRYEEVHTADDVLVEGDEYECVGPHHFLRVCVSEATQTELRTRTLTITPIAQRLCPTSTRRPECWSRSRHT